MNNDTPWQADPRQLRRMLEVALTDWWSPDRPQPAQADRCAMMLRQFLAQAIAEVQVEPAGQAASAADRPGAPSTATLGRLVLGDRTTVESLRQIKTWAKRRARAARGVCEHGVAVTLYLASVAGALVFHGSRISAREPDELARAFAEARDQPWLTPELAVLFERALDACQATKPRQAFASAARTERSEDRASPGNRRLQTAPATAPQDIRSRDAEVEDHP